MTGHPSGISWWTCLAAVALCLAALALSSGRTRSRRRAVMAGLRRSDRSEPERRKAGAPTEGAAVRAVAALAGVATAIVVGGWAGVVLGAVAAVALDGGIRRLEPRTARHRRAAVVAVLPFAADLLAAALVSGAPTARAVGQVGDAIGGPLGEQLRHVARTLALGAPAAEAWTTLGEVPDAAPLVRAFVRSGDSGAALSGACERLAAELRAGDAAAAEAAARRSAVFVVLPLGCCFLPAFVLVGVLPVVLGVLDGVLR